MIVILAQNWFNGLLPPIPINNSYINQLADLIWKFNMDNTENTAQTTEEMDFQDIQEIMDNITDQCNSDDYEDYYIFFDIPVYVRFNRGRCNITDYETKQYAWESVNMIMGCVNEYFQVFQNTNPNVDVVQSIDDIIYVAILNVTPKDSPFTIIRTSQNQI